MTKFLFIAVKFIIVVYLGLLISLYFLQRNFMYMPPGDHPGLAGTDLRNMSEVEIVSSQGDRAIAWFGPPSETQDFVVMYFHGNGSSLFEPSFIYKELMASGYGVMAVEYPGYPHSTGRVSEAALVDMAVAHYDYLIAQGIEGENIVLYGTSLGAGVATQLAARRATGRLILEAPFNSMLDMVRLRMPFAAYPFLIKDKYLSHEALDGQDIPMLWIHGTRDAVIPMSEGEKLFDGYDGPKDKLIIPGGQHHDLWFLGGREAIFEFLAR